MKQISLLFVVFLFDVVFTEKYIITRRVRTSRGEIQPDLVQIPSSLCHNNGTTECQLMDGKRHSVCQCICSNTDESSRLYKSTFQFQNETWKCAKNAALHKLSGCSFSLDGAGENVLATLPSNDTISYTLSNATTEKYISLPVGTTCVVSVGNSAYLNCSGQWEQLNSTLITKRFRISYKDFSGSKYGILVWVNSTERLAYPLPSGRIIRLAVTCSDRSWEPSQCIVAKVQGKLECPFPVPPTTTPRPSTTSSNVLISATPLLSTAQPSTISSSIPSEPPKISSSISQTPSTVPSSPVSGPFPVPPTTTPRPSTTPSNVLISATPLLSTAQPSTISSSIPSEPPKISSSISQTPSTVPSSPVLPTSLSSPKPNTTTVPIVNNTDDDSGKIAYSTLIGALLGGIAALVALVIIIVIIVSKRRKKRSEEIRKTSRAAMVIENESYEQEDEGESHHPYENVNLGFVPSTTASALNNNVNCKGKPNVGGHRSSVANKVYEVVEELDNQPSKPNTEGQQDPTNRTRKKPLPSISESPMFITFRDPHHFDSINDNAPESQYAPVYDRIDGTTHYNGGLNEKDPRTHGASSNMPSESYYDTIESVIEN